MTRATTRRIGLLGTLVLLFTMSAAAQDFRGTIKGIVTDESGGVLPGVTITVTNVETNVFTTALTDAKGGYNVPYLNSGSYSVEARLEGLRPAIRKGITIRVSDVITADFSLSPGAVEEVMTVTASAPLLDVSTPVSGQVVDSNQIQQLPLGDGTAYMLTRLAPGLADSSDLHFSRPMDNGNLGGIVANGAMGGNEFTLDGATNRVSPNNTNPGNNSGVVGFSPPSDAISEFKVATNSFDAQSGHTAGATINLALKSGTNSLNGTLGYFNRNDARSATPLLTKRANGEKPTREYDRMTGTLSGPVLHDRTFYMVSFERLKDIQPEPSSYTVPTLKMRNGDLSEWGIAIYDPRTATGSTNARTPFGGAIIPQDRINAIAKAFAAYYPEPNRPGLEDNYFTNMLRPYDYNGVVGRVDHNVNNANKLFLTGYWNKREEDRYNWALGAPNASGAGEINGFEVTHGFDYRSNKGATVGYTSILGSSLYLDTRVAWSQFGEWRTPAQEFDPAKLGWSPDVVKLFGDYKYLPLITFGGFSSTNANSLLASLGSQRADFGTGFNRPFTNLSFTPTASWLWREHSLKGGYELRRQRWEIDNAEYVRFHFNGAYTRQNNSAATNVIPQSWAQFLLGLPTTGTNTVASASSTASQFEIAADGDYRQNSHALFVQDDWRISNRFTVNLGMRFEYSQSLEEAGDRNLGGFNAGVASPIEAAAIANYAKSPIAEIPVGSFAVKGGLQFADGAIYNDMFKFLPRAFGSFLLNEKTLLRAGLGLFSYDYYFDAGNQLGFSQQTGVITTENNGTTFLTDLTNPIPSGQLTQPAGSSRGLSTGLGLNLGTVVPSEREIPYYTRWQLGAQRDLGRGFLVDLTYIGSRGSHLPVQRELNGIPTKYLSQSRTRDTVNEAFLSASVANPFVGMLPGTGINGATTTRLQLLRPYPQFLSVISEEYRGEDKYDAGSIRVEKRFSKGNSILATYTRSKATDQVNLLNPAAGVLEDRISPNDRPHRGTLGATFQLPFGHGEKWGSNWGGFRQALLGGWSVSTTYQYQTGAPLVWSTNLYYDPNRDPRDLRANIGGECANGGKAGLDCPAWDISGFYIEQGNRSDTRINVSTANNFRYFPSTLGHVRTDDLHLMDVGVYKTFQLLSGVALQVRIEVINALNYTVLWNPNQTPTSAQFGFVNQDRNNPRDVQIGGRLTF